MPLVRFHSPFEDVSAQVDADSTLLEAAEKCGAKLGHVCGGVCACSTCHVWVKQGLDSLSEQADDEMDRLDQAFDVRPMSRLGCQARVGNADVSIDITEESLNAFMDENPAMRRELEAQGRWPLKKG
jgi:2Fe-2S ferredoxin